jgi:hypothetical protein
MLFGSGEEAVVTVLASIGPKTEEMEKDAF